MRQKSKTIDFPCKAGLVGEDFPGMRAQLFGIGNSMGWESRFYPVKRYFPSIFCCIGRYFPLWLMGLFLDRYLPSLEKGTDILISIGGYGGWMGALMAKKYHLPIIQIQNPRSYPSRYDLILACEHDSLFGKNIISLPTALHGITASWLKKNRAAWEKRLNPEKTFPFLGVLLGGNNGRYVFDERGALEFSQKIKRFLEKNKGKAYIVSSRRTPDFILKIFQKALRGQKVSFWGGGEENPYRGILACADVLAVTGDSVSMLSEAVATEAAVGIFPLKGHSKKLEKFHHLLFSSGRAQAFTSDMKWRKFRPLNGLEQAVVEIHKRFSF